MSWNYRILRKPNKYVNVHRTLRDPYTFMIIEAYYDKHGKINGWCERRDILEWSDIEDLKGTIELVKLVIDKPILEEKNGSLIDIDSS